MKVTYDKDICIHNGQCVKNLPNVFQVKDKEFIITQDGASEDEIKKTVGNCPSGALKII